MASWHEALTKDMSFRVQCATNMLVDHLGLAAINANIDMRLVLLEAKEILQKAIQELEDAYAQAGRAGASDDE